MKGRLRMLGIAVVATVSGCSLDGLQYGTLDEVGLASDIENRILQDFPQVRDVEVTCPAVVLKPRKRFRCRGSADGRPVTAKVRVRDAEGNVVWEVDTKRLQGQQEAGEAPGGESSGQAPPQAAPAPPPPSAPPQGATSCGDGLSVGPNTSCPFARNVRDSYPGAGVPFKVYSPVTDETHTMTCTAGSPIVCRGGKGASVYFP